ncbi:MAG: hypothetical protein LIO93_06970 [Bacteroidales bacterium]|nr:hypothetical protein [Bacteroidales bacterium]
MRNCILLFLCLLLVCACNSLDEQHADKILNAIDQKDKNFEDIKEDTLIFAAADFFIHNKNQEKAALACYYCARLYQCRNDFNEAMEAYLKAETYAKKLNDYELLGSINYFMGVLYYHHNTFGEEAREKLKTALEITQKYSDNYKREISIHTLLGNIFHIKTQTDSAIVYFNEALKIAEHHKDTASISLIYENLSVQLQETGKSSGCSPLFTESYLT